MLRVHQNQGRFVIPRVNAAVVDDLVNPLQILQTRGLKAAVVDRLCQDLRDLHDFLFLGGIRRRQRREHGGRPEGHQRRGGSAGLHNHLYRYISKGHKIILELDGIGVSAAGHVFPIVVR